MDILFSQGFCEVMQNSDGHKTIIFGLKLIQVLILIFVFYTMNIIQQNITRHTETHDTKRGNRITTAKLTSDRNQAASKRLAPSRGEPHGGPETLALSQGQRRRKTLRKLSALKKGTKLKHCDFHFVQQHKLQKCTRDTSGDFCVVGSQSRCALRVVALHTHALLGLRAGGQRLNSEGKGRGRPAPPLRLGRDLGGRGAWRGVARRRGAAAPRAEQAGLGWDAGASPELGHSCSALAMSVLAMFFSPARYSSLTDSNLGQRPERAVQRRPPTAWPWALL